MKKSAYAIIFLLLPVLSLSQFSDDFNDGDFTSNPTWSGDTLLWQVVAGQLNSNSTIASSSLYLSAAALTGNNVEWRIYMNLKFSTSSANYVDFYIASDSSNLLANGSGYFVRIGGTADEISLYRKDAGSTVKIIDGTDGRSQVNSSDNKIHIKITRSSSDSWNLYDDNSGTGLNYFSEGIVSDATYATGSYLGLAITQSTASFFNKHFFDDVYAGVIQVDTIPPTIASVNAISVNEADVLFNEPVELISAQTALNYSVNNSIGNPLAAVLDGSNPELVHLTFGNNFTSGLPNILTVVNVKDLSNNAVISTTGNFTYAPVVSATYKDVIISEIFADPTPSVGLPAYEFVEIYNRSTKTFDLSNWHITDGTSNTSLPNYILTPGQYLILCSSSVSGLFTPFGPVAGLSSLPSLNNDGDHIQLTDNNSTLIDEVDYTDRWYRDNIKMNGGWTLELINPTLPANCSDSTNWIASANPAGGTPGQQNSVYSTTPDLTAPIFTSAIATDSVHVVVCFSEIILSSLLNIPANFSISQGIGNPVAAVALTGNACVELTLAIPLAAGITYILSQINLTDCAGNPMAPSSSVQFNYYEALPADSGDVIINEILFNPKPYSVDYVEIYNRSQKAIDLSSLIIGGADKLTGEIYGTTSIVSSKTLLLPGQYAVVTENAPDIHARFFVANPAWLYQVKDVPTFDDKEGIAVLMNLAEERLDQFHYYDTYQFPLLNDKEGIALERLSSERPTQDATNWHSAAETAGFGTPTYKNSESSEITEYGTAFTISPEIFSPDGDGINDIVNIVYHFDSPGYVANVTIYDAHGRIVRKLVRNTLLGNEGAFSWDGINENLEKPAIGIYIIYIEVFNRNGDVKKYKKTCVLGSKL